MKERNPLIDVLKGFTIILVVIGHACQWFSGDDRSQPLYTTIYAFHMPLFMFLSGYVSFNKRGEMNLLKRFQVRFLFGFSFRLPIISIFLILKK